MLLAYNGINKGVIGLQEVKRCAEVGEKIRVVSDERWDLSGVWKNPYPVGSEWIVRKVYTDSVGTRVFACEGNAYCISATRYVVLEESP